MRKYLSFFILLATLIGGLETAQASNVLSSNAAPHTINFLKMHNRILPASSKMSINPQEKSGLEQHCDYPDQSSCWNSSCTHIFGYTCQECTDDSYQCIPE